MKSLLLTGTLVLSILILSFNINNKGFRPAIYQDSLQAERDKYINEVKEAIKGKETLPVDSVFKNLKVLSGFQAHFLTRAMNAWSRALGVSCTHCHNTGDWADDTKPQKDIARQMSLMSSKINQEMLKQIKGLKSPNPVINCTTCHYGKLKPALNLGD